MLVSMAVADAFGSAFEFRSPASVKKYNDVASYHPFPERGLASGVGKYTDDTQMAVAIAELLVEHAAEIAKGWVWTPKDVADRFVAAYQRDPRGSYSPRFADLLKASKDGTELLAKIKPDSDKSGAAMRAMPIGYLAPLAKVLQFCSVQAAVTHNTPDGISAALASAAAAHYFIHDVGPKADLAKWLEKTVPGHPWATPWAGSASTKGIDCVRAAVTAIGAGDGLRAILKAAVDFTGDTDTVAAIAVACASCSKEVKGDLPDALTGGLEDGQFGRKFLADLDAKLSGKDKNDRFAMIDPPKP